MSSPSKPEDVLSYKIEGEYLNISWYHEGVEHHRKVEIKQLIPGDRNEEIDDVRLDTFLDGFPLTRNNDPHESHINLDGHIGNINGVLKYI